MRRMMLTMVAGVVLLTGCASAPDVRSDVDYARIWRIETAARSAGVQVYWLNLPTKSTAVN